MNVDANLVIKTKPIRKPFDLTKARAGVPVETADGKNKVVEIFVRKTKSAYPLIVVFEDMSWEAPGYTLNGVFDNDSSCSNKDLVILEDEVASVECWVNIYRNEHTNLLYNGNNIYGSEQEALNNVGTSGCLWVGTFHLSSNHKKG